MSRHDRDPHRIRFSRPRRQGTTEPAQPPTGTDVVVERDDGLFQIGLDDDAALSPPSPRRRGGGKTRCQWAARQGSGEAAYAAPAHSSHFTGAQLASSTTSNAARGKPAALEQGKKSIG